MTTSASAVHSIFLNYSKKTCAAYKQGIVNSDDVVSLVTLYRAKPNENIPLLTTINRVISF